MTTNYIDITKHGFTGDENKKDAVAQLAEKLFEGRADCAGAFAKLDKAVPLELFDFLLGQEQLVLNGLQKPSEVPDTSKAERDLYDAYYTVLYSLLLDIPCDDQVERARKLAERLATTDYSEAPELRLKNLMILYNSLPVDSTGRFATFAQILAHAKQTSQLGIVRPYVGRVGHWHGDWGITQEQTHELYLQVADVYRLLESPEEQIKALYTLLDRYEGSAPAELAQHADVAVRMLTVVIDAPHVLDFTEYLGLAAVQHLTQTQHKALVQMVDLLARGDLKGFTSGHPASAPFFAQYGLSHESCLTKMRLLTLANIAQTGELPLSHLAQELGMDEAEAEQWVVRAVSSQILNARVDQIKRVVLVKSAFQRSFGQDQWTKLHEQLGQWIGNLERISGVLATTRTAA